MNVLVTGGYGYIGGRLIQALARERAVVPKAAGRRAPAAPQSVPTAVIDWTDDASLAAACEEQNAVIHLAAMNEAECERDPIGALRANGGATLSLLRAAISAGASRFIYVSTSKVFGANPSGAIDERSLPRPASHYAITQRLAEDYVLAAHDAGAIEGVVVRLSNAVGAPADPHANAWMLIANDLCRQAATTGLVVLRSSGTAWRNFIGMADTVAALRHLLMAPAEALHDGLFHLGGRSSLRILDLAAAIAVRAQLMFGREIRVDAPQPAPGERAATLEWRIDKLVSTGWSPSPGLDDEIDATLRLCGDAFCGRA